MSKGSPTSSSLKELDAKLNEAACRATTVGLKIDEDKVTSRNGLGLALKVGVEFVSAIFVGVAIGVLLDYWFGTKPWLMVVFFLMGSAAGFLNIFRLMSGYGRTVGYRQNRK